MLRRFQSFRISSIRRVASIQTAKFSIEPLRVTEFDKLSSSEPSNSITADILNNLPLTDKFTSTIYPNLSEDVVLEHGGVLPKESIHIKYATYGYPEIGKKILLLCPSMSNSVWAIDDEKSGSKGWWRKIIGSGSEFGIDLNKYFVICGAPIGSPFGSTSPISKNPKTGGIWGPNFPQITPKDQANFQKILLDSLNIPKVYGVIGGSMGGMQALQFALSHPENYDVFVSIAATGKTSPGIVALRSVQREAVKLDPLFKNGHYDSEKPPVNGLKIARKMGQISYRSQQDFDERFSWEHQHAKNSFEIEDYLEYNSAKFINNNYDTNCYLLNSKSMDLQSLNFSNPVLNPQEFSKKEGLLLSYDTDRLTPSQDHLRASLEFNKIGVKNYFEVLKSKFGHDAFLVQHENETKQLNIRIRNFLQGKVDQIQHLMSEVHYP